MIRASDVYISYIRHGWFITERSERSKIGWSEEYFVLKCHLFRSAGPFRVDIPSN
jgi:hypothetical protein